MKKQELYELVSKQIPKDKLVVYTEDGKQFTGYQAQYAIDLLNESVGVGNWKTETEVLKQEIISNKGFAVAGSLRLSIHCEDGDIILLGYGGAYAKDIANAYKGFNTSAFKNACRFLGIGKELYIQQDEDISNKEVEIPVLSNESNNLAKSIDESQNLEQLDNYLKEIEKINGENIKLVLVKKYNKKRIELTDKK